jgi:hypothetical protein
MSGLALFVSSIAARFCHSEALSHRLSPDGAVVFDLLTLTQDVVALELYSHKIMDYTVQNMF